MTKSQKRSEAANRRAQPRRGRPAAGTQDARRDLVLDACLAVLVEEGAERLTMAEVARRAGASKETLYRWFGDKHGLFEALIQRNADRSADQVGRRLAVGDTSTTIEEVRDTLVAYSTGLLVLLAGSASIALNRAAMTDPALRDLLLRQGRHRIGPIVERYLGLADTSGAIDIDRVGGAAAAFELLYGLVVRDTQIRVLLGEPPPSKRAIETRSADAVDQFLTLCGSTKVAR